MNSRHSLYQSINIAPVDGTSSIHSQINIDILTSSVLPPRNSIPSPCESISETEESDDPYDFNIVIISSDEETDVVEASVESVNQPNVEPVKQPKNQPENQPTTSPTTPPTTPPPQPPKWRQNPPFNHDFSYDYLSILSHDTPIGSTPSVQRTIQTPNSTLWNVEEKHSGQRIEVLVKDDKLRSLMHVFFSNGKLHGRCSFWSSTGTVEGEWENGQCKWKTISYEQNKLRVTYRNELPSSVEDLCRNPPILFEYRDGFFTGRMICDQQLYVMEVIQNKGSVVEVKTVSPAQQSFRREGKTFVFESNQLRRLDLYSNDRYLETLRLYEENQVMVMRGSVCVYKGSFDSSCLDGPVKGCGEIYENGNVYRGEVVSGIPHGRGEYFVNNKPFYKGDFRYGVPHGKGILGVGREDSFLFGYRLSDLRSFKEHFHGLLIQELCGHLMLGNDLDESKLEQVFPEYVEDCRIWNQYCQDVAERKRIEEMRVRRRSQNVSMRDRIVSSMGPYEGGNQSIGSSSVENQRMSLGNGSMNIDANSTNETNSVNRNLYYSTNSTLSDSTDPSLTTSQYPVPSTNSPYRNSSVSPMTPTSTDTTPSISFDVYALNTTHINPQTGRGSLFYSVS